MAFCGCSVCYSSTKDEILNTRDDKSDAQQSATSTAPTMPPRMEYGYQSQRSGGSGPFKQFDHDALSNLSGLETAASEYTKKFPKDCPCAGPDELRWINYMMTVMWPNVRQVLINKARNEIIERTLIELQKHKEVKVQEFDVEFDPGPKPPILRGLHAYRKEHEEHPSIEADVDVEWTPGREFVLRPKLKGAYKTFHIDTGNVYVSGLEFSSVVSCVLAPLVDKEPCFGVMQIFFQDPPGVRMYMAGLKQMAGGLGSILKGIMEKIILRVLEEAFVLPHRLVVPLRHDLPLETLVSMKSPVPIGVLEVEILEAEHLIAADKSITGKLSSDPYVECSVGLAKMRSSTIANTLNPKWADGPDHLLVYNLSQVVRLEVYDDDTFADDLIGLLPGYSVYWLCQEAEGKAEGHWFDLQAPEAADKKHKDPGRSESKALRDAGRIKLRIRYLDVSSLKDIGPAARAQAAKPVEPWRETPYMISVKLLGLEGDLAAGFVGSRCSVEFLEPKQDEDDDYHEAAKIDAEDGGVAQEHQPLTKPQAKRKSVVQRTVTAIKSVAKAVEQTADSVKKVTGLGFGKREHAVATKKRSTKARPWAGHIKEQRNSPAFAIPPMVVRAIEQLYRREKWDTERIAEMFGVDVEAVKVAEGLRTNFDCVWHEALHFLSVDLDPFSGGIRIDVYAAPGPVVANQKGNRKTVSNIPARQLIGEGGLIGSVRLDLKHETLPGDEPYRRRVRARLRRKKVDPELSKLVADSTAEHLRGESQCDESLGEVLPGVLIEFLVEIRATNCALSQNHLDKEQVIVDKEHLLGATRKKQLEVILT
mmetsp:Transcript_12551/g.28056  ORF Transcript_12551/g.28056 Transcript_12551/m.28056 type:complete len:817 (+) Transcript_12551:75-2525(+)